MNSLILDFSNSGISAEEHSEEQRKLLPYSETLHDIIARKDFSAEEASLCLLSDNESFSKIKKCITEFKKPTLKYVVVIGIGGSNLGTLAIYDALFGTQDVCVKERLPKLLFLDTTSEEKLTAVIKLLEKEKSANSFVINIISKSGTTTETIVNFEVLYGALSKKFKGLEKRVVVTTDFKSPLWEIAEQRGFAHLSIPKKVGGRYSVFSAVGLFPLGLVGVKIKDLLTGAWAMQERCLSFGGTEENPAAVGAVILNTMRERNISIHNNFFFAPELESLGKWVRQLVGESLGKEHDTDGNVVHAGITPIVSIGSTDLHSMAQLYFGGPRDKFTTLVVVEKPASRLSVPKKQVFGGLVENIGGKSVFGIMNATAQGVSTTYQNLSLPYNTIAFSNVSAASLGEFLQYKMLETMYLAKLMKVNAFDQPNVEIYKQETRKILAKGR
jgi:glucose-6-phosphate isomerase